VSSRPFGGLARYRLVAAIDMEATMGGKDGGKSNIQPASRSDVPRGDDLTKEEKPGGTQEMPASSRARPQRKDDNSQRDSNDLGSGVST
jgi:hypothetical protein